MNESQMDLHPDSFLMLLVRFGRWLSSRRLWVPASIVYAVVLRLHGPKIDSGVWRELNVVLGASGLERLRRTIWRSTNTSEDIKIERIKLESLRGRNLRALANFMEFSEKQFPAEFAQKLQESFRQVAQDSEIERDKLEGLIERYTTARKIVLVAGLDFSGSTAVFDFLREFENAFPVQTEIPHLSRGRYCLYEVSRHLDDKEEFRRYAMEFFCRYILGYSRITEAMDFRIHKFARRRILSGTAGEYAESVTTCATLISAISSQTSTIERRRIFHALVNQVLTEIVVESPLKRGDILVLRNAIKAVNLSQAKSLGKFTVFACFRDPRDSYVAQNREKFNLGVPVDSWVARASKNYRLAASALQESGRKNSSSTMVRVQFEDFVRSDSTRRNLAELAGLSTSTGNSGTYFQPSRSRENIGIFRDFGEPSAISVIEETMADFLHH